VEVVNFYLIFMYLVIPKDFSPEESASPTRTADSSPLKWFGMTEFVEQAKSYFDTAANCLTVLMNVVVARVKVRSRRYATPSSRHNSSPLIGMSFTRPART